MAALRHLFMKIEKKEKISVIRKLLKMHFLFNILFFSRYISPQVDTNGLLQ